jgi:hypothetical protein
LDQRTTLIPHAEHRIVDVVENELSGATDASRT